MPAGYPKIDPPHRQPDGTYLILVHRAPGEVEEVPAKDLKAARETARMIERIAVLVLPRDLRPTTARGRPTSLTPELQERFFAAISDGASYKQACDLVGITYATLKNWRHWAQEGKEPWCAFFADLKKHEAEGDLFHLRRIRRGEQNWQSSAWWLERRRPRWRMRSNMPGAGGGTVTVAFHRPLDAAGPSDTIAEVVVDGSEAAAGGKKPVGNDQTS